ncbi:protein of unknown function DUF1460 [Thalassoporum mexicanum PCC 7367]|uniref:N-acetylmuramoyl-L-alanine amidase-like domain-containing protein n=1 Tax=Thalassoporum mexicanum TaxID=3457544 RepID=UPI00029FC96D|nr:N-acetylmuramoyl-L-alanine amidase-like domain-containing protein [Pseudanabaena sp. PCC 7367]AFY70292.1 protein of unknown function DUF1460 [Pseudanabaena sp. PCC 7367]
MNSAIALALISLLPIANLVPSQTGLGLADDLQYVAQYDQYAASFTHSSKQSIATAPQTKIIDDPESVTLTQAPTSDRKLLAALDPASDPKFQQIMQVAIAQELHQQSYGEMVQSMAAQLIGSGYREGLLDRSPQEKLVVSLTQFDCVLLVEIALALAMGVAVEDYTPTTLAKNVQSLRYSDGEVNGYCSRLHYFSDWINDNQKRGQVVEIGDRLGGLPLNKPLRFMSNHWQLYPKLIGSKANRDCITAMEKGINTQQISYVPTDKIRAAYGQLQPGDIIAIATEIEGLDVTHTGLAYRHSDGNFGLIHASPVGRVVVSHDLQAYIARQPQAIGILVARPISPGRSAQPQPDQEFAGSGVQF